MGMLGRVSHFRGPFWLQFGRFWRPVGVLGSCMHFLSIKVSGMGVCWGNFVQEKPKLEFPMGILEDSHGEFRSREAGWTKCVPNWVPI